MRRAALRTILLVAAGVIAAACTSPEARRTRGGGPGADVGNRPANVRMHEGSQQFWRTPERLEFAHAPTESALQARELSRP